MIEDDYYAFVYFTLNIYIFFCIVGMGYYLFTSKGTTAPKASSELIYLNLGENLTMFYKAVRYSTPFIWIPKKMPAHKRIVDHISGLKSILKSN